MIKRNDATTTPLRHAATLVAAWPPLWWRRGRHFHVGGGVAATSILVAAWPPLWWRHGVVVASLV